METRKTLFLIALVTALIAVSANMALAKCWICEKVTDMNGVPTCFSTCDFSKCRFQECVAEPFCTCSETGVGGVDIIAPTINVTSPEARSYNTNAVPISVKLDESAKIETKLDNGFFQTICAFCTSHYGTLYTNGDGAHNYTIRATDAANNSATKVINFLVDSNIPIIISTAPLEGSYATGKFRITYMEQNLVKASFSYRKVNDSAFTTTEITCPSSIGIGAQAECTAALDVSQFEGGQMQYYFTIEDIATKVNSTKTKVGVDSIAPVLSIENPIDQKYYNTSNMPIQFSSSEKASLSYTLDTPYELSVCNDCTSYTNYLYVSNAPHVLTVFAVDKAGNRANKTISFMVDNVPPSIINQEPHTGGYATGAFRVQYSENNLEKVFLNIKGKNEQSYVSVEGSCPLGYFMDCLVRYDISRYEGQEINYYFTIKDAVNTVDGNLNTLTVDSVAPNINVTSPLNNSGHSTPSTRLDVQLSEKAELRYALDSNYFQSACYDCSTFSTSLYGYEGSHVLKIQAVDKAGNTANATRIYFVDTIKPVIIGQEPKIGEYTSGNFRIQYTETNLKSVSLFYRGNDSEEQFREKSVLSCPSGTAKECIVNADLLQYDGRQVQYYFKISDSFSSANSEVYTVNAVSPNPPVVAIESPKAGVYNASVIVLNATSNEIAKTMFAYLDSRMVASCYACKALEQSISATDGMHELVVVATDLANDIGNATRKFEIDTCVPQWVKQSTACTRNDTIEDKYTDANNCYYRTLNVLDTIAPRNVLGQCNYTLLHAPVLIVHDITVNETALVSIERNASDPDQDYLSFTFGLPLNSMGTWQTDLESSGIYVVPVSVTDGEFTVTRNITITVLNVFDMDRDGIHDQIDTDMDNDGMPNTMDRVMGMAPATNIPGISLTVGGSMNLNQPLEGTKEVRVLENGKLRLSFTWDFNISPLYLGDYLGMYRQAGNAGYGSLAIRGLSLQGNAIKSVAVDRINGSGKVCILDQLIDAASTITATCTAANEHLIACDSSVQGGYSCIVQDGMYIVTGLRHSLVAEFKLPYCGDRLCSSGESCTSCSIDCGTCPASASGGGGGGGGDSSGGGGGGAIMVMPKNVNQTNAANLTKAANETIKLPTDLTNASETATPSPDSDELPADSDGSGNEITGAAVGPGNNGMSGNAIAITIVAAILALAIGFYAWQRGKKPRQDTVQ